ncbi:hypothetical protein SAMN04515674_102445 [Pseudarcicella hirudinis]|uniref:Uncharacterized protein n=1 Tax=Pseudarcicella hirudinis TaxID=1079859 RepID=A0A1I5PF72_9BACT|nr:hypothetical protein SAMN04515674_102445 [Pseudarcicella hirudinis]
MVFINCKEANLISFTLFSILFERFEQRNTGISPSKDKKNPANLGLQDKRANSDLEFYIDMLIIAFW